MRKEYNPDDIKNSEKHQNQKFNEAQSSSKDINEEFDNKYDAYLKENQSPDYKFGTKGKNEIDFNEFQKDKPKDDFDSELDNKYNEYIKNGKKFNYEPGNPKKTDD